MATLLAEKQVREIMEALDAWGAFENWHYKAKDAVSVTLLEALREAEQRGTADQRATIERLERALKPFADAAGKAEISGRPPCEFAGASDFENARAALSSTKASVAPTGEDRGGR